MEDEGATLGVGFAIDFYDSFGQLKSLDDIIGATAADAVRDFQRIETASRGAVNVAAPKAALGEFGAVVTRTAAQAEKSAESMVRQIQRQAEAYGKTTSELRNMRAEQRALNAEQNGMTELAARLRAVSAELNRLEASGVKTNSSLGGTRAAMQGLSFQAQDTFTQISMGANILSVLAIQGGQAAGQMVHMQGTMGKVANFLIGPWGLAFTGGLLLLGALTKGMFDNEEAAKLAAEAMKKFQDRQSDISNFIDATTGRLIEQNRVLVLNATLTRQAQIAANDQALSDGRRAAFKSADTAAAGGRFSQLAGLLTQAGGVGPSQGDIDVQKAIKAAAGDVDKLATSIANLARTKRPDLKGLALDITNQAGQAIIAQRENAKLGTELRALAGDTTALAKGNASLIKAQVELATATTPLTRARAQLALVEQQGAAAEKSGGAALVKYRGDLTSAMQAVHAAEASQKAYGAATRDAAKEAREAAKAVRESKRAYDELEKTLDTITGKYAPAQKAAKDYAETLADINRLLNAGMVGAGDAIGLQLGASREASKKDAQVMKDQLRDAMGYTMGGADDPIDQMLKDMNDVREAQRQLTVEADLALNGIEAVGRRAAEEFERMANAVERAGDGLARAFGPAGASIADMTSALIHYGREQKKIDQAAAQGTLKQGAAARQSLGLQVELYGDMASAAKGFFEEGSSGYKALMKAEQTFRAIQFALSVRAMAQDIAETASALINSGIRTAKLAVEAVTKAIASMPFPLNLAAGAATAAALVAIGATVIGSFGGGSKLTPANEGRGTVLGNSDTQSESIKNALNALKDVNTVTSVYARQMASSLRSIESQIGNFAAVLVRQGDSINASGNVATGFKPNLIGSVLSKIPLIGGLLGGLFGTRTDVIGSGLFGGPQSVGSIRNSGFDASYYSDVQKTKKFLGIVTGRSQSTEYGAADPALENQFTLILRQFNDAIVAAAGPLGQSTADIQNRLNSFVVNIGKIDLKDLTGEQIEEKLSAIFGAAADNMAAAAFPGMMQFQKVGEGAFETLVRVASTIEAVGMSLDLLGKNAQGMGLAAKLGLADQFDSVSDLTSAADAYFQTYYSQQEQSAARTAQLARVFGSLNLTMPTTLAGFRRLVEAQDLNTTAGQAVYATLLQLAPAFADLQGAMEGAKSAADIASERQNLEKQLMELRGDTAALRAMELAKLDASNRFLQQQIWDLQDAQEAARAADELRKAWQSVGDSITTEVARIRGLANNSSDGGFASLLGKFNATSDAARLGDQDAAKSLPGMSQALLAAAALVATSRQELLRLQAQTAASLEATNDAISKFAQKSTSDATLLAASAQTQAATEPSNYNQTADLLTALADVRAELGQLRAETTTANVAIISNTNRSAKVLENVSGGAGGDSFATVQIR